jgi:hypothetical protein
MVWDKDFQTAFYTAFVSRNGFLTAPNARKCRWNAALGKLSRR